MSKTPTSDARSLSPKTKAVALTKAMSRHIKVVKALTDQLQVAQSELNNYNQQIKELVEQRDAAQRNKDVLEANLQKAMAPFAAISVGSFLDAGKTPVVDDADTKDDLYDGTMITALEDNEAPAGSDDDKASNEESSSEEDNGTAPPVPAVPSAEEESDKDDTEDAEDSGSEENVTNTGAVTTVVASTVTTDPAVQQTEEGSEEDDDAPTQTTEPAANIKLVGANTDTSSDSD